MQLFLEDDNGGRSNMNLVSQERAQSRHHVVTSGV